MLHAMKLSSVWPIDFQYHSQAELSELTLATAVWAMSKWWLISQFVKS